MSSADAGDPPGTDPIDYDVDLGHPQQLGTDIRYGAITFYRDKNPNGLAPSLEQDGDGGPWLRLAVVRDSYLRATAGDPDRCDRCELRDGKLQLGTPVSYSFEMRAERAFPGVTARCVCAQIKAPYYDADGGSPLFALRIDHGHFIATIEHLYETKDVTFADGAEVSQYVRPYAGPGSCGAAARALDHHVFGNTVRDFKEMQVRAVLATDSGCLPPHLEDEFRWCTNLVKVTQENSLPDDIYRWWRFTVRVAPTSVKDEDGILQLLVADPKSNDERLIATATGEFGHAGEQDPATNTGPAPGEGLQYFKIGPYRDKLWLWGGDPAAIHVRNIRRRYWADGLRLRKALVTS